MKKRKNNIRDFTIFLPLIFGLGCVVLSILCSPQIYVSGADGELHSLVRPTILAHILSWFFLMVGTVMILYFVYELLRRIKNIRG